MNYKGGTVLNQIQSPGDKEEEEKDEYGMHRSHPAWTQKSSMKELRSAPKLLCIQPTENIFMVVKNSLFMNILFCWLFHPYSSYRIHNNSEGVTKALLANGFVKSLVQPQLDYYNFKCCKG